MNIGILGGAFDPIHKGHLSLCKMAFENLPLHKIFIVPSFNHPFKGESSLFSFQQRCELITLAIEETFPNGNKVIMKDIEKETPSENFTYQTLEKLHVNFPDDSFYFLIGSDNLSALYLWKNLSRILLLSKIVCFYRKGYDIESIFKNASNKLPAEIIDTIRKNAFSVDLPDVSSAEIRNKIKTNISLEGLTPSAVIKKIQTYKNIFFN